MNTTTAQKSYHIKPLITELYKYNQYSAQYIIILGFKEKN